MNQDAALGIAQQALWTAVQVAAPLVLAGLAVGIIVSVFQAATQIQEQSLVFIPKVTALVVVLLFFGGWMLIQVVDFARAAILSLPNFVR